jgi:hypothetical protein
MQASISRINQNIGDRASRNSERLAGRQSKGANTASPDE